MAEKGVREVAERLYYNDPGLTFDAVVTEIQLVAQERTAAGEKVQLWRVALDRTAFYPESGGQPWDTGRLVATARSGAQLEALVERVEEDEDGQVWHFVRKPLLEDTVVRGEIDAGRRLDHMQQHSGQHLLSAVVLSRLGLVTSSFHLGEEVSTIDLSRTDAEVSLAAGELAGIEDEVNRTLAENRAVRVHTISTGEAEAMLARGALRKLPPRTGPFRVIEMDGVEWNACGGTHVRSTAEIGCVLLRRVERVRQGLRVEFVCGLRAVRRSRAEFDALQHGAHLLGTGWTQLGDRVQALVTQQKMGSKRLASLEAELAKAAAREMLHEGAPGVLQKTFEGQGAVFARDVAAALASASRTAVIGATAGDAGAVSLSTGGSPEVHAGELLRAAAAQAGARGGGAATLAHAACAADQVPELVSHLLTALAAR